MIARAKSVRDKMDRTVLALYPREAQWIGIGPGVTPLPKMNSAYS